MAKVSFVFESCNKQNDVLRNKYQSLKAEEQQLREKIRQCERRIEEIKAECKDLNKAEVNVVLDYVRSYSRTHKLNENDIDIYLCHCQNKLNGNLNSTFLRFTDPMEAKYNESTYSKS